VKRHVSIRGITLHTEHGDIGINPLPPSHAINVNVDSVDPSPESYQLSMLILAILRVWAKKRLK